MSIKDIASLGKLLAQFLSRFGDCFTRQAGRRLLGVYGRGLLSDVQRKNVEAIAVDQNVAARTLQRFLESIKWDEDLLRHRCQRIIASEHARKVRGGAGSPTLLPAPCCNHFATHTKRRLKQLQSLGIDPDQIKSVSPKGLPC